MVIKGSVQMRKRWESSALLLSERKVCQCWGAVSFGRGSTSCLETALWLRRLGKMSEDAGLCWGSLTGLCSGKGAGLTGAHAVRLGQHSASGWTVTPVHAVPSHGGNAGGHSGDHVSARALRAAQHPPGVLREIPPAPPPPGSYPSGFVGFPRPAEVKEVCQGARTRDA